MDAAGLMTTSQSTLIVTSSTRIISTNVTLMLFAQLHDRVIYRSNNNNDEINNSIRVDVNDNLMKPCHCQQDKSEVRE